jgi:hypothetical protein
VTSILVAMITVLLLCVGVVGLVLVGIEGRGKRRAPKIARRIRRAARHLNGDGQPPARFVKVIESTLHR